MFVTNLGRKSNKSYSERAKPYCQCWSKKNGSPSMSPTPWRHRQPCDCSCGEENEANEWKWEMPDSTGTSWVVISNDQKQVTFHPFYSSGTAAVKGDSPMSHNYHYYWEVKMLTETYGTDIMIGLGTNKVNISDSRFEFTSLLGQDSESYGLSYTGVVRHNATTARDSVGFCRGSIVGVRVDMWRGTVEFYLNRKSQGISFYNLRRHQVLYPIVCSTAANSSMRLIYSASWKASLLVDAAKILAASVNERRLKLPPGLWNTLRAQFWLTLPTEDGAVEETSDSSDDTIDSDCESKSVNKVFMSSSMKRRHWQTVPVPGPGPPAPACLAAAAAAASSEQT